MNFSFYYNILFNISQFNLFFHSVQSFSHVWLFVTQWTIARQASLSITTSRSPPKPMSIESGMPSNHLILIITFSSQPSIFPSIRVFPNESALRIRWPKLGVQLQHQSFQWTPRTDLFRMDWLDLLAVQGTLKRLLRHHSSKASILGAQEKLVKVIT